MRAALVVFVLVGAASLFAVAAKFAQAAPVAFGDPFNVHAGKTAELENGATLQFLRVTNESRCPAEVTCLWQGEAKLEIELRADGKHARESLTTQLKELTLLGHRVQLLGVYPAPPASEPIRPDDYVAMFRVAEARPAGAKPFKSSITREDAARAAERYIRAFSSSVKEVCTDWETRGLVAYARASELVCDMGMHIAQPAQAVREDAGAWRFYFRIDDAELIARIGQPAFRIVEVPKSATDALDQVRDGDVGALEP
jgi:hypothetical protein